METQTYYRINAFEAPAHVRLLRLVGFFFEQVSFKSRRGKEGQARGDDMLAGIWLPAKKLETIKFSTHTPTLAWTDISGCHNPKTSKDPKGLRLILHDGA